MSIQPDYKMLLVTTLRSRDVELSEDVYRRMGSCSTIACLNNFFHGMIAQYAADTLKVRSALLDTDSFDHWITSFNANVLPYLSKRRLPACTDTAAAPMYQCQSKDSIL